MRTDIPAYFWEWFMNRIKEGYVMVRNPYNPIQVTRYSLSPDVVDLIAFCTKNPKAVLNDIDKLKAYGQYWYVTITPYGKDIEPNVPSYDTVIDSFKILSQKVGIDSIGWRYDPIIVDEIHTVDWHIETFENMAKSLSGFTNTVVISFIDIYKKVEDNFPSAKPVGKSDRIRLGKAMAEIAKSYGMVLRPCAEGDELAPFGADCSGCMTLEMYEKALSCRLNPPKRSTNQRNSKCACLLGSDIGVYDTCYHFCKYCYANTSKEAVIENFKQYNPASPFLIGGPMEGDIIHDADQESWIEKQLRLDI